MRDESGCFALGWLLLKLLFALFDLAWSTLILYWVLAHPQKVAFIWGWMWN